MTGAENQSTERIRGERRDDRRYNLALDLRWKLVRRRKVLDSGSGKTLDLSSRGLFFDAGRPLPVGLNVEISIAWPALLHNVAPMQLVVSGKIVRADGLRAAVRMAQHEFRTAGNGGAELNMAGKSRAVSLPVSSAPFKLRAFQ
jgi:PilZ domain